MFLINVYSSWVCAFLICSHGGITLQFVFCTFLYSALWFGDPSMLPWAASGSLCCLLWVLRGGLQPHFGPRLPLYCPLCWHHAQTHSGHLVCVPIRTWQEWLEHMSERGLLGHRICAYFLWVVPDYEQSPLLADKTGAARSQNCSFHPFSPHGNNSQNRYLPSRLAKPQTSVLRCIMPTEWQR